MKEKDLNKVAKIERAIKEKYGEEAIQNPKNTWDEEKEKFYLDSLREFYNNSKTSKTTQKLQGFTLRQKSKTETEDINCPVCGSYLNSSRDDLYLLKFQCCFDCYIKYVDGREERWKTGWRPIS